MCLYVCSDSRFSFNARNPFVTAKTCEWYLYFCLNQAKIQEFMMKPKKQIIWKTKGKNTGKSLKKPRGPVKRFWEMSEEDVNKLKRPEQLDYNLDVLFVSLNCALYRTKEVNFTFPKTLRNKSRHETVIKRSSLVANPTQSQAQRNRRQKNLMMQKCLTSLCFSWWIFWTSFNLFNPFIFVTR